MGLFMKACGPTTWPMEKARCTTPTEMSTSVNGRTTGQMGQECTSQLMAPDTKENGSKTNNTDEGQSTGLMALRMSGTSNTAKRREKGTINKRRASSTRVTSWTTGWRANACTAGKTDACTKADGNRTK